MIISELYDLPAHLYPSDMPPKHSGDTRMPAVGDKIRRYCKGVLVIVLGSLPAMMRYYSDDRLVLAVMIYEEKYSIYYYKKAGNTEYIGEWSLVKCRVEVRWRSISGVAVEARSAAQTIPCNVSRWDIRLCMSAYTY